MNFLIPTSLETPRIHLRMFEEKDLQDLHAMYSDEECVRYTFKRIFTIGDTWRQLAAFVGHWLLKGYGPFALVEKSSNRVMGVTGLWFPTEWPEPEMTWSIARQFWGQGYVTEAATAIKQLGSDHLAWSRLISLILPENQRSIMVAKRLNGIYEKSIPFRGDQADVYVYDLVKA